MSFKETAVAPDQPAVTPAKMDAALKAKWIAALRSGEFKQCRGSLQANDEFCCLGVLNRVGQRKMEYGFDALNIPYRTEELLVEMNDRRLASFSEIADYIEQNL